MCERFFNWQGIIYEDNSIVKTQIAVEKNNCWESYDTFRTVNWYPRDDFWSTVWVKLFYL